MKKFKTGSENRTFTDNKVKVKMKGVKTMKRTHNNDIEELLDSNYDFDCCSGNRKLMDLCDFSSNIYECAKESYQNDNYSDEYSFFEFSARLYG